MALAALLISLVVSQVPVWAQERTAAETALTEALAGPDGEYAARAEYEAILKKFGDVLPYSAIIHAEERHIAALKSQFEKRGWTVPEDVYAGRIEAPTTLKSAAEEGLKAEERNVTLYDRLLPQVQDQPDITRVFTRLQWASRERHLPAFKLAAAADGQLQAGQSACGGGGRQGRGRGPGKGGCCCGGNVQAPGVPSGK